MARVVRNTYIYIYIYIWAPALLDNSQGIFLAESRHKVASGKTPRHKSTRQILSETRARIQIKRENMLHESTLTVIQTDLSTMAFEKEEQVLTPEEAVQQPKVDGLIRWIAS